MVFALTCNWAKNKLEEPIFDVTGSSIQRYLGEHCEGNEVTVHGSFEVRLNSRGLYTSTGFFDNGSNFDSEGAHLSFKQTTIDPDTKQQVEYSVILSFYLFTSSSDVDFH